MKNGPKSKIGKYEITDIFIRCVTGFKWWPSLIFGAVVWKLGSSENALLCIVLQFIVMTTNYSLVFIQQSQEKWMLEQRAQLRDSIRQFWKQFLPNFDQGGSESHMSIDRDGQSNSSSTDGGRHEE
jgi:hypothetical protein